MGEKDDLGFGDTLASGARRSVAGPVELSPEAPDRYTGAGAGGATVELGRGGLGRVSLMVDRHLGREVAVKELLPGLKERLGPGFAALEARFIREAQVMARLEHPGLVPVHELVRRADGTLFFTMKRVTGRTLAQALAGCATLPERLTLLPHLRDVAHTVGFAHAHGVVHRDLKPDNVMVGPFGETQVLDWGLARVAGQPELAPLPPTEAAPGLTVAGTALGTPRYMSPEQASGALAEVDERSDVWSLGVMLFELLSGAAPFDGTSTAVILEAVKSQPLPRVLELEPHAPAALVAVVTRAVDRDRSRRFPSAEAFAEALDAAMLQALEARRGQPRWVWALLALAVVAAGGVGARTVASAPEAGVPVQVAELERAKASAQSLSDELAAEAFEHGDVARAAELTVHSTSPAGRGVAVLARAAGIPSLVMELRAEAGCAALAANGGELACATLGGVQLFSADGRELEKLKTGVGGWQRAVAYVDDSTLVSAGDDRVLHVWNVATRTPRAALTGSVAEVSSLAVVPGGDFVVIGSFDGEVRRIALGSGESLVLGRHQGPVRALAATAKEVASAGDDAVQVWPLAGGASTAQLSRGARALWPRADGRGFMVGAERFVLSLGPDTVGTIASEHQHLVQALVGGTRHPLISAGADKELLSWREGRAVQRLGLDATPTALAVDPELLAVDVYVALDDRRVQGWRWPRDGRLLAPPEAAFEPTAWLPAPDRVALVGQRDGSLRWMGSSRGLSAALEEHHRGAVTVLAGTARVLSGGEDGSVVAHPAGKPGVVLQPPGGPRVNALAVSEERVAWAQDDGTLVLWSLEHGAEISRERTATPRALAFAGHGLRLVVGREDKHLAIVDSATGHELETRTGHDGPLTAVAARESLVVSAGKDRKVLVWSLEQALPVRTLTARSTPFALALSDDGARLAAGLEDGSVLVWRLPEGVLELDIPARAGRIGALAFEPGGLLFAAGTDRLPRWLDLRER